VQCESSATGGRYGELPAGAGLLKMRARMALIVTTVGGAGASAEAGTGWVVQADGDCEEPA